MISISNARIGKTYLGFESHGILTLFIETIDGSSYQSIGGFGYDYRPDGKNWIAGGNDLTKHIRQILEVFGVDSWEKVGGFCRIKRDGNRLIAIGHIVEDKWWEPGFK